MAPNWFIEQQEEEKQEGRRIFILEEAARQIASGATRQEAIRMAIENLEEEEDFNRKNYINSKEEGFQKKRAPLTHQEKGIFNSLCEEYTHWSDLGL